MRTRSRGLPNISYAENPIPDLPQITIPLFTHPPVPFCPFPEARFPTLEYPVPVSEIEGREEERELASNIRELDIETTRDSDSDSNDNNSGSDSESDGESEFAGWLEQPQDVVDGDSNTTAEGKGGRWSEDEIINTQDEYPQYQHNISEDELVNMNSHSQQHNHKRSKDRTDNMGDPSPQRQHNTPEQELAAALELRRLGRWTARDEPGEFEYPDSWSSSDEEGSKPRCKPEGYNILPGWTALHPGVKLVIMTEVVSVYGIKEAPKMLHLTNDEINAYVDLQEQEAAGKAYEEVRTKEFNDFRFKQMLAGRLDKDDSMKYIDEQIANGSVWESATLKMSRHDLRAGGRFLAGIGLSHIYPELEQYWGMDVDGSYIYEARAHPIDEEVAAVAPAPAEPPSQPHINPKKGKDKPELGPPEIDPDEEIDPSKRWMPMAKRNLFLDKVKKPPKKSKPLPKKRLSNAKGEDGPALTPSKLRMSTSINDISPTETSPVPVAPVTARARVARQLSRGEDPAKSLEREVRRSVRYVKPSRKWAEMDSRPRKGSKEHHMREQLSRNAAMPQSNPFNMTGAGSETPPVPSASNQHKTHSAKFARPELHMKWAKKSSAEKPTSSRGALTPPSKTSPPAGFDNPVPCALPRRTSPEILSEKARGKRKRSLSQDPFRPFDDPTGGPANKRQKNMVGKPTPVLGNKNTKEQGLESRRMSFEMRKAGDDARMKQPPMGMGSMEQDNGGARRLSREATRSGAERREKTYLVPTALMFDEDDPDL